LNVLPRACKVQEAQQQEGPAAAEAEAQAAEPAQATQTPLDDFEALEGAVAE
jgi:hypothetical protein